MIRTEQFDKIEFSIDKQAIGYEPNPTTLYLRHKKNKVIQVQFLCPCGCGDLRIIPTHHSKRETKWHFTLKDGQVTLDRSIRHLNRCQSHYFINKNKVRWA